MKHYLHILIVLAFSLAFVSCGGGGDEEVPPVKSSECDIKTFSLKTATNLVAFPGGWVSVQFNASRQANVEVEKPEINLASIQARFTISAGATIKVGNTPQVSEVTANNYTSPVTFRVTAEDGVTRKDYTVRVTRVVP